MDKKRKEEILEKIEKASSEEYEVTWEANEKAIPKTLKKKTNIIQGKKSRASGAGFELKVRKDLQEKGWVVDKWSNNVALELGEIIPAKRKFNPFNKVMTIGTGFPDFIALRNLEDKFFDVIGVEVKVNGSLDKEEKAKCKFLLEKKVFSEILIASKGLDGKKILIKYEDVKEKYKKVFT